MAKIYESIEEMVGHTPLVCLNKLIKAHDLGAIILAKCEFYNPIFSIKDRTALHLIAKAPFSKINSNTVFIEASSGNTAVSLAAFCAHRGYKLVIVMPENVAPEKAALVKHFGAEVLLTPADEGMTGALHKVEILKERAPNLLEFKQFENPLNIEIHQLTTAVEIMEDTDNNVDALVCGVGSGGSITGIASTLKSCNPDLYVTAVKIASESQMHKAEQSAPLLYNPDIVNEIFEVTKQQAVQTAAEIAQTEGIPAGLLSAAALYAALDLAKRPEMSNKNIVVILPDCITANLSTLYFDEKEIRE